GVPLIAVRRSYQGEPAAAKYYPNGLSFPVTAFLRPIFNNQTQAGGRPNHQALLELYDPLSSVDTTVAGRRVPLESDLSTPLAYFLSDPTLESLATVGLLNPESLLQLRPDRPDPIMGLYMVQPYEPGKIPVLLVHGLWSSPMTWMEMFNDLRSQPEIRKHFQFWFYLYPTGQPFWNSAAQLRRDLAEARHTLDPYRQEPSLDQMVLIGHSMGGLVSRLQTINSRNDFWNLASAEPFDRIRAELDVRQELHETFFFRPNPSIARIVTVGTPHAGSTFSNETTQWMLSKLITLPQRLVASQGKLFRDNPGAFEKSTLLKVETSIDSLSPDSPIFRTMQHAQRGPWVKYHNIIGAIPNRGWWTAMVAGTDGVVTRRSAQADDAISELTVPADHTTIHLHPMAVQEVRRILLEHLADLRAQSHVAEPVTVAAEPRGSQHVPR
ncbi:MAG: alpha/beta fold hydrolase, partial [Candidatus Nealsonbacteria bacterium]|nr:alpha/beta fold hydrolase [Candidatus Nealsonbacteria bacterium]